MGQNKNVLKSAIGEMKHFLLGAALVLTLVAVVPVLAQDPGPGPGPGAGGGGGGGGGGGTDPRTGGGTDPRTGGGTDPRTGGGTDPRTGGGTDPRTDRGLPESCPEGETGTPPNCSGATGGADGTRGGVRGRLDPMTGTEGSENVNGGREGGRGEEDLGQGGKGKSTGRGRGRGQGLERAPGQTGEFPERREVLDAGQGEDEALQGGEAGSRARGKKSDVTPEPFGRKVKPTQEEGASDSEFGGRERGGKMKMGGTEDFNREGAEGLPRVRAPYFDPSKEKGFDKELLKLYGKKPSAGIKLPEIEEGGSLEEDIQAFQNYLDKLISKSKKLKIKALRQNAIAFYSQLSRWCEDEEVECGDELAELKFAIRKAKKQELLDTLTETWTVISEKVSSGDGEDEDDEDEEEEFDD